MRKLKIFLADLIHNQRVYNYGVPLNIGYIAAKVLEKIGDEVEIRLFKFPDTLLNALSEMPDIIALSNYDWNVNLNRAIISIARKIKPDILIVMGGPNIRKSHEGIRQFLISSPDVDLYIINEGEYGFLSLIEHILDVWPCHIKKNLSANVVRITNNAYLADNYTLIIGEPCITSKEDPIPHPSPWLSGLLDPYLNSYPFFLDPLIETNRGCPYQCAYCTWGTFENRKVRKFDLDIVIEELRYVFKKADYKFRLFIADANFGIFERDLNIAEEIRRLSDHCKSKIIGIYVALSQKNIERNLEIVSTLGEYCMPVFAMQSLNKEVLINVGRRGVNFNKIEGLVCAVNRKGLKISTDLLIGLPGETKESHIDSVKRAYDMGFYKSQIGPIRLLAGSRMEEDDFREKYEIETGFRVIPSAYGEYGGHPVIEYEECIIKNSTLSRDDFLSLRLFGGYIFLMFNLEFGRPLLDLSSKYGLHPIDLILAITKQPSKKHYPILADQVNSYSEQAGAEWFVNENSANDYYLKDDVFKRIMVEGFAKLNYDFAAKLVTNLSLRQEFVKYLADTIKSALPHIKALVVDDVARFSLERIYKFPLNETQKIMVLAIDALKELSHYVLNNHVIDGMTCSNVKVQFNSDDKVIKILEERIKPYENSPDLSYVVQEILHVDNKSFTREGVYIVSPQE